MPTVFPRLSEIETRKGLNGPNAWGYQYASGVMPSALITQIERTRAAMPSEPPRILVGAIV
jgi:hypothetical protein